MTVLLDISSTLRIIVIDWLMILIIYSSMLNRVKNQTELLDAEDRRGDFGGMNEAGMCDHPRSIIDCCIEKITLSSEKPVVSRLLQCQYL